MTQYITLFGALAAIAACGSSTPTTPSTITYVAHMSTANGGVFFPFVAAHVQNGQVASGTINLDQPGGDSLLVLLNNGSAYTNVHTVNNPMGEIRGQITRQ